MPQIILQYKLFEYDIRDETIKSDSEDYLPGKDNKNLLFKCMELILVAKQHVYS